MPSQRNGDKGGEHRRGQQRGVPAITITTNAAPKRTSGGPSNDNMAKSVTRSLPHKQQLQPPASPTKLRKSTPINTAKHAHKEKILPHRVLPQSQLKTSDETRKGKAEVYPRFKSPTFRSANLQADLQVFTHPIRHLSKSRRAAKSAERPYVITMPKPRFTECPSCQGMFTVHSIDLHAARCMRDKKVIDSFVAGQTVGQMPRPSIDVPSCGKVIKAQIRPGTMTLSKGSRPSQNPMRTCYVCGLRIGHTSLEIHERKCVKWWHTIVNQLPTFIDVSRPPKAPDIPSIDGSRVKEHTNRIDDIAAVLAVRHQTVHCSRCRQDISLSAAVSHANRQPPCRAVSQLSSKSNTINVRQRRRSRPPLQHSAFMGIMA